MQAVLPGDGPQHSVIVRVLVVPLDDVVVDVLDRSLHPDPRHPQLLELHAGHGSGSVLEERLVHAQRDRRPRLQMSFDQVLLQDLVRKIACHERGDST